MSYFAKKLEYCADDGEAGRSFMAVVEVRRRKNGNPYGFFMCRYVIQYNKYVKTEKDGFMMIYLPAKTSKEAIERFWPFVGTGKEFFGHNSEQWKKSTAWFYEVAVGGSYTLFTKGEWISVGRPALKRIKRRKKKPLKFGNISHILMMKQEKLYGIEEEISSATMDIYAPEPFNEEGDSVLVPDEEEIEYKKNLLRIEELEREAESMRIEIQNTLAEMRFTRDQHPKFLSDKI